MGGSRIASIGWTSWRPGNGRGGEGDPGRLLPECGVLPEVHRGGVQGAMTGCGRAPRGVGGRRYGLEFQQALLVAWEASGYVGSQRLQPLS